MSVESQNKIDAREHCIERLQQLAEYGSADPESTGALARQAVQLYLNSIGEQELVKAWDKVARYF